MHFRDMPDGDVLVSALIPVERGDERYLHHEHAAFFSGHKFASVEQAFGDGSPDHPEQYYIKMDGGRLLKALSSDECSRGLLAGLYLQAPTGRMLKATSLVFLLDQPKGYPPVTCEEQPKPGFRSSVVVLQPQSLHELRDGSMLVAVSEGLVMRVRVDEDGTICTGSRLLGRRLFLVDTNWLMGRARGFTASQDGKVDWPKFFGCPYRRNYQGSRRASAASATGTGQAAARSGSTRFKHRYRQRMGRRDSCSRQGRST